MSKSQSQTKKKESLPRLSKNSPQIQLAKISDFFADILFPVKCISCGKEGVFICKKCLETIPKNSFQICPVCEKTIMPNGDICRLCKENSDSPLNRLFVVSDYQNKLLARAIHSFKYNFVSELSEPLGELMVRTMSHLSSFPIPEIIIPIPLHRRRLRWRGFNQSELLSNVIAKNLLPGMEIEVLTDAIERKRFTKSQMKVKDHEARQRNMEDCFVANTDFYKKIKTKRILLVDDVCTTGSTIGECAKELRKLHPKSISAVVLARQS